MTPFYLDLSVPTRQISTL